MAINKLFLGDKHCKYKLGLSTVTKMYLGDTLLYVSDTPYSERYLTLDVLTSGTILWKKFGTIAKTISYSTDNGDNWTTITATTAGTEINVTAGDKVLIKGENSQYATSKANYSGFDGGTATYNIEGNIMSLISGDSFTQATAFTDTYVFCSLFKNSKAVSAKNLVLPVMTLTDDCYRAMFSFATLLEEAPELPATTLATECYWYMFESCPITEAPDLNVETLVSKCYGNMFINCSNLSFIKCMATSIATANTQNWVSGVSETGIFVCDDNANWTIGKSGIPTGWSLFAPPIISYDGFDTITLSCTTNSANIYYRLNKHDPYVLYSMPIVITADTYIEAYSEKGEHTSIIVSKTCMYVSDVPVEYSNRDVNVWEYSAKEIKVPYSVNAIDGHSSNYAKGNFSFETEVALHEAQPTYLWFQHADQSAEIYVDNTLVDTHWGGYNAFFTDISNYVHSGKNEVKVVLNNTTRSTLAPCAGDFNFNATLGYVKLFTSHYLPSMNYGYDGFHITSTVSTGSATINVATNIPTGATVVCTISGVNCNYTETSASTGNEMIFTTTISNPRLWNGTIDPYLYNVKLEIYHDDELYHVYERPYGLRFYEYVIDETVGGETYTGFLLNGEPYFLRGVCMHNDLDGKANALTREDIANDFALIQELGCNFIRLAHYPHPKEVYDWCDRLGIVVQTEVPWVNNAQSTQPSDYYTHLEGQYTDMVNQHYNHPSIMFWGLANEITTDDADFGKTKIEGYTSLIKSLDSERLVGYVMSHSQPDPSAYYNNPDVDWFGGNIYVGWYISQASNNPTSELNRRINNIILNKHKALAFSEYGAGGTQHCHSENPQETTTKGNNPRHDIEYQMWLHEGHIAAIRNFPQLLFTAEWQLFDIAVSSRNEGYTVCLDGEETSIDNNLRRLNDKGIVERDHVTKKDTFYIYKAEWSSEKFVHICGKDYTRRLSRTIKCYTNETDTLSLYVNNVLVETTTPSNHIATFSPRTFNGGDVVRVDGNGISDTFIFDVTPVVIKDVVATFNVTSTSVPTQIGYNEYTSGFSGIEIDGEVQLTVESAYTFSTLGEHIVKYKLEDNTIITPYAFANCVDMTKVDISATVTGISENAFDGCISLSNVTIPYAVTTIGEYAFANCSNLTRVISIPMTAPTIGQTTFKDVHVDGKLFYQSGATGYNVWMDAGDYYLGKYNWNYSEGVLDGDYGIQAANSTWAYGDVDGVPLATTDEDGYVTSFAYTTASSGSPVEFDGATEMDTHFLPFKGAKSFEIIFHCRARQDEQTYRGVVDGINWDNLVNILEFKLEKEDYEGVGLRFSKQIHDNLSFNYRKYGDTQSTNHQLLPLTGDHADEWNYRIVYQNNRFTMYDRFTDQVVKDKDNKSIDFQNQTFGNIDEISVCIGAAFDHTDGIFYRFGTCEIYEFSVNKLTS